MASGRAHVLAASRRAAAAAFPPSAAAGSARLSTVGAVGGAAGSAAAAAPSAKPVARGLAELLLDSADDEDTTRFKMGAGGLGNVSEREIVRESAALEDVATKRALRAAYSQRELDDLVAAIELRAGRGRVETAGVSDRALGGGTGLASARTNLASRRRGGVDFKEREDPLLNRGVHLFPFDARALTLVSTLTWNAAPSSRPADLKATLTTRVCDLGLPSPVAQFVRSIAGARHSRRTDELRVSSERHADAAANKRECVERLVQLVGEATALAQRFGELPTVPALPRY